MPTVLSWNVISCGVSSSQTRRMQQWTSELQPLSFIICAAFSYRFLYKKDKSARTSGSVKKGQGFWWYISGKRNTGGIFFPPVSWAQYVDHCCEWGGRKHVSCLWLDLLFFTNCIIQCNDFNKPQSIFEEGTYKLNQTSNITSCGTMRFKKC